MSLLKPLDCVLSNVMAKPSSSPMDLYRISLIGLLVSHRRISSHDFTASTRDRLCSMTGTTSFPGQSVSCWVYFDGSALTSSTFTDNGGYSSITISLGLALSIFCCRSAISSLGSKHRLCISAWAPLKCPIWTDTLSIVKHGICEMNNPHRANCVANSKFSSACVSFTAWYPVKGWMGYLAILEKRIIRALFSVCLHAYRMSLCKTNRKGLDFVEHYNDMGKVQWPITTRIFHFKEFVVSH